MVIRRSPQQVAKRALILGALSMRGSLEVTRHPHVVEFSERLLPWLIEVGCEEDICAIEREQFLTPLGLLSDSQWLDVKTAGEAAMFFCWTLQLIEDLSLTDRTNDSCTKTLQILQPEAENFIANAKLRPALEIVEFCRQLALIRSMLQEARVSGEAKNILRRVNVEILAGLGIRVDDADVQRAEEIVKRMNPEQCSAAGGLMFIRSTCIAWLLNGGSSCWDDDADES